MREYGGNLGIDLSFLGVKTEGAFKQWHSQSTHFECIKHYNHYSFTLTLGGFVVAVT